jgi:hypothetical protein
VPSPSTSLRAGSTGMQFSVNITQDSVLRIPSWATSSRPCGTSLRAGSAGLRSEQGLRDFAQSRVCGTSLRAGSAGLRSEQALQDSTVLSLADPALPCRATTVPSPAGTGSGFTNELCDERCIVLSAESGLHLADGKILIWTNLIRYRR